MQAPVTGKRKERDDEKEATNQPPTKRVCDAGGRRRSSATVKPSNIDQNIKEPAKSKVSQTTDTAKSAPTAAKPNNRASEPAKPQNVKELVKGQINRGDGKAESSATTAKPESSSTNITKSQKVTEAAKIHVSKGDGTSKASTTIAKPSVQPTNNTAPPKGSEALKAMLKGKRPEDPKALDTQSIQLWEYLRSKETAHTISLGKWNGFFALPRNKGKWSKPFHHHHFDECKDGTKSSRIKAIAKIQEFTKPDKDHVYYQCIPVKERGESTLPADPKNCSTPLLELISDVLKWVHTDHGINTGHRQSTADDDGSLKTAAAAGPSDSLPRDVGAMERQAAYVEQLRRGGRQVESERSRRPAEWKSKTDAERASVSSGGNAHQATATQRSVDIDRFKADQKEVERKIAAQAKEEKDGQKKDSK